MSNADFLATAFVQIRPKTTGFQKDLRDQLKTALSPINPKVNVSPTTKGFIGSLRTQVRDAIVKSGPHRVPVVPTLGAFRAQLAKELNQKPIPVTVTTVGKGAVGSGVSGATKAERELTTTQIARERITDELRESENLLKQSLREGIPLKEKDALVTRAQSLARSALTRITEGQLAGERALVEARLKARGLQAEQRATREAGVVQNIKDEAEAQKEATAQAEILANRREALAKVSDRLVISMDRFHSALRSGAEPAQKLSAVERELGVIERERIALQEQLQGSLRRGEKAQANLIKTTINQATAFEDQIKAEKATLETKKVAQSLNENQSRIASKLAAATKVEISSLTSLKAVREQENILQRQSTALDKLEESAQKSNSAATLTFVEAKRAEIAARKQALASQGELIRGGQKEVTNQKNVGRGLIATSLSFLGLRGATLAAGGAFLAGAAAASTFAKAIQTTAEFETQLNVFQATAGATADEMERVSETAKQLGADVTLPAVSAGSAAKAMTELAKAGLEVQDSIDGARGVLQLATAAEIDQAQATELVASALNAFALEGTEATRVADLLTGAANESQGTITDMGIALQQASAVARQAGVNLEDTVAFITLLAQAGIRGSDAGTSLRTAILRLISPTEQAAKIIRNLGLNTLDAAGNLRPEVFSELQQALAGLETTARNQALRKIFGQDAIRAAVVFGREGVKGLNSVREATQEAGLAAELAEARTKGFAGQVEALRNNAGTLGITLGKITIGPLGVFIETINEGVSLINKLSDAIDNLNNRSDNTSGGGFGGFVDSLKSTLSTTGGDVFRNIGDSFEVLSKANRDISFSEAIDVGRGFTRNIARVNSEIRKTVSSTRDLSKELQDVEGPEEAIRVLEDLSGQLIGNSEDAETARQKIQELQTLIIGLGRKPTIIELAVFLNERGFQSGLAGLQRRVKQEIFELNLAIPTAAAKAIIAASKVTGENAADIFIAQWADKLDPKIFAAIMKRWFKDIPTTLEEQNAQITAGDNALFPGPAKGISGKEILGRIAGFDAEKVRAEISGSTAALVAVLREEQAFLQAQLQREIVQKQPGLKRQIEAALLGVINDLAGIAKDQKQAAEDRADKIKQDQKEAAQNVVDSFNTAERKALNAQIRAEQTEGLRDDIATSKALLALYNKQKTEAKKRIKDAETLAAFLADVNQKIFQLEIGIAQDQKSLRQQIRQEQREARDRIIESIELDVELAEINENTNREIALRRKLIKALEDQIKHEKGNTLRIKELRNEIARQKQAIRELQQEEKGRADAGRRLQFEFLQRQQGFAANLLGNLIPLGNVAGLVGNVQISGLGTDDDIVTSGPRIGRPGSGIPRPGVPGGAGGINAAMAVGSVDGQPPGPTRGQGTAQIELLRRIVRLLEDIKTGDTAPEAKRAKKLGGANAYAQ